MKKSSLETYEIEVIDEGLTIGLKRRILLVIKINLLSGSVAKTIQRRGHIKLKIC